MDGAATAGQPIISSVACFTQVGAIYQNHGPGRDSSLEVDIGPRDKRCLEPGSSAHPESRTFFTKGELSLFKAGGNGFDSLSQGFGRGGQGGIGHIGLYRGPLGAVGGAIAVFQSRHRL